MPAQVNLPAVGQRIRLLSMPDDPQPLPAGMIGIVTRVRPVPGGSWQVEVDWEDSPKNCFMGSAPPPSLENGWPLLSIITTAPITMSTKAIV